MAGSVSEIVPLIWKRFKDPKPEISPGIVLWERLVCFELYTDESSCCQIKTKRFEIDDLLSEEELSELRSHDPVWVEEYTDLLNKFYEQLTTEEWTLQVQNKEPFLFDIFPFLSKLSAVADENLNAASSKGPYAQLDQTKEENADPTNLSVKTIRTSKLSITTVVNRRVNIYPSSFDIDFEAPTAVCVKSSIQHLHFRPKGLHYNNPRDLAYYRALELSADLKYLSVINAFHDDFIYGRHRYPFYTPYNQEHKIDFEMVISEFGLSDKYEYETWLQTPITIDPPLNNGGGD